jgi:DNA-binding HxlR family transcriptional regulator
MRFPELECAIPLAPQEMLIQQLRNLVANGLISRTIYKESSPRVEYAPSEIGKALRPALRKLLRRGGTP